MTRMPVHIDDLANNEPFPVKPDTNEYKALSFLVAHCEYGFTPGEIADHTNINESSASKTMARLFEKELVKRSKGTYYVDPDRADKLKQRLESLISVVQLFESTPTNDTYAKQRWEDELPSIAPDDKSDTTETQNSTTTAAEAENLIRDLEDNTVEK